MPEEITLREHLRRAGSVKSERKAKSSRENGSKYGGRKPYPRICPKDGSACTCKPIVCRNKEEVKKQEAKA